MTGLQCSIACFSEALLMAMEDNKSGNIAYYRRERQHFHLRPRSIIGITVRNQRQFRRLQLEINLSRSITAQAASNALPM